MASKRKHNKKRANKPSQTSPSQTHQQLPPSSSPTAPGSPDLNKKATPAVAHQTPKYTPAGSVRTVPSSLDSTPLTQRSTNLPSTSASSTATAPHLRHAPPPTSSSSAASDHPDLSGSPSANKPSDQKSKTSSQPDPPEPPPSRELIHPAKRIDHASKKSADLASSHGHEKGPGKAKKASNKTHNTSPQKPTGKQTQGHDPLESSVEMREQVHLPDPEHASALLAAASAGHAQLTSGRLHSVQPAQALLSLGQAAGVALETCKSNENALLKALKSHGSLDSHSQAAAKNSCPGQTDKSSSSNASANADAKSETSQTVASKHESLIDAHSTKETDGRPPAVLDKSRCQSKDNSRRTMSGATDRFDFDAQQREHAGPGLGRVKKARRGSHVPADREQGAGRGDPGKAELPSEMSNGVAAGSETRASIGQRHAQVCLRSAIQTSAHGAGLAQQTQDLEPSLVQIYLSYFDQDQDGNLDPLDTWRAIRRLGFGLMFSTFAALVGHAIMSLFGSNKGLWNMLLGRYRLPIERGRLNGRLRHHVNVDSGGLFSNTSSEDQLMEKVGPWAVWQKTCKHMGGAQMIDPINWLQFIIGWIVVVGLTWPKDLTVKSEEIDGVYNGDLLFLIARKKINSSTGKQEEGRLEESIVVVPCEEGGSEKEASQGGSGGKGGCELVGAGAQKNQEQMQMQMPNGDKESLEVGPSTLLATVL